MRSGSGATGPRARPLRSPRWPEARRSRSNASRSADSREHGGRGAEPPDSGVMPQTREHLAIVGILGVDRGVVALTKRGLVDDEWAALAKADVAAVLQDTPLRNAAFVEVSATARSGLDDLVRALVEVLVSAPPRHDAGRPRLPIDRAFTLTGFGTVVTGTLVDGAFAVGDEVAILPTAQRARIRGIQTHKRALESDRPGSRVALNLSGIEKDELARGMVV